MQRLCTPASNHEPSILSHTSAALRQPRVTSGCQCQRTPATRRATFSCIHPHQPALHLRAAQRNVTEHTSVNRALSVRVLSLQVALILLLPLARRARTGMRQPPEAVMALKWHARVARAPLSIWPGACSCQLELTAPARSSLCAHRGGLCYKIDRVVRRIARLIRCTHQCTEQSGLSFVTLASPSARFASLRRDTVVMTTTVVELRFV